MTQLKDFIALYRLYRVKHSRRYALRRAYEISFLK
jgi:hypothetical protein